MSSEDLQRQGYTVYANFTGRGSALYVKNAIVSTKVLSCVLYEAVVWAEMKLRDHDKLLLGVVCRSPSASEEQNNRLIETIAR